MGRTNDERSRGAEVAFEAYIGLTADRDDPESELGDLITDLFHLAAREGYDLARIIRCAIRDFNAETEGDEIAEDELFP